MTGKSVVVVFNSDGMGRTDAQPLRDLLARKFLGLLDDGGLCPDAICFYTDGVKLVCEGSPILTECRRWSEAARVWSSVRRAWTTWA